MNKLSILCFFVLLIYYVKCDHDDGSSTTKGGYNFPEKSRILNKTRTYISAWLNLDQMNAIAAALENMASPTLLQTKTLDELKADVINVGLNALTSQQKVFVTTAGAKFLGKYGNYENSLAVAQGILMNNCMAFASQLLEMYSDYEARGKTQAQIFQRGFKMADMFMTKVKKCYYIH
uniref:Uncharacterized protein n=1 Tax=Panagrolaimus sp. PS1159 TaxID=55785 RepID=A0AC35F2G3_9BILA